MGMFKLIALRPLHGCRKSALKCLKEEQIYYFCNDYSITDDGICLRDVYVKPIPEDFFTIQTPANLKININAVVGMNGDGKSTLIELMMRLINNCAKHYRLTDKDNLLRVEGIKAELFYMIDEVVYCIREDEKNQTALLKYADIRDHTVREWKKMMTPVQSVSRINELFYTIVSNYSLYAYNIKDFREEWSDKVQNKEESWKCWLHYLFHKNDGYRTPMTLHPYRYEGNIDVNTETALTMQRLMALYIQEPNPQDNENSFRKIGDKEAGELQLTDLGYSKLQQSTIIQYFQDVKSANSLKGLIDLISQNNKSFDDKVTEDLYDNKIEAVEQSLNILTGIGDDKYRLYLDKCYEWLKKSRKPYSSKSDVRLFLNVLLEAKNNNIDLQYDKFADKYKRYDKLNVKQLARLRYIYEVMLNWDFPTEILVKDYSELSDIERCQHYIVYKTIDICRTYPEYRDYLNGVDSGWNNNGLVFRTSAIGEVVYLIKQDKTHVTLKLRQCLSFIGQKTKTGENLFEVLNDNNSPQKQENGFKGSMLIKFDDIKHHYSLSPFPLELLPPPIYRTEILYKSFSESEYNIPFSSLSSGEKQILNNFGALIYHLRNLDSVDDDKRRYENVNIILEEIELYFHPEFQRMVVKMLLDKLCSASFTHIKRINITFVTHSPFILSDIPLCNVLFLKAGRPSFAQMQENTFGANIHGMLKNGFFLPSLPIGEFAHEKINNLFERLNRYQLDVKSKEQEEWFYSNIMRVGEPYLREQLMNLFNMHYPNKNND